MTASFSLGQFGHAISLSGETLVVSAPEEDSEAVGINGDQTQSQSSYDSGAVYVFTRDTGAWSQQAYIKASNAGRRDMFGSAVALVGDTLAVGAFGESGNATGINGPQIGPAGAFKQKPTVLNGRLSSQQLAW